MTRHLYILLFISSYCFGQSTLPTRDTIIRVKEGYVKYKVYPHAIFVTTTTKEGLPHGPFRGYYKDGKIWSEYNNVDGRIEGECKSYTREGKVIKIEEWKKGTLINARVFYSSSQDKPQKYYFISDTGFVTFRNGKQIRFDSSTPDSIIQQAQGGEYMWIKGERKIFSGNPIDLVPGQRK